MNANGLKAALVQGPLLDQAVLPLELRLAVALLALLSVPFVLRALALLTRMLAPLPCWRFGHALELRRRGARYLHQLIVNTPAEIFTIDVLFKKVLVVNPSLDRVLAKHVHETSLARVISIIGQKSLELSDKAVGTIAEYDPRPAHSQLFAASQGSAALAETSGCYIREHVLRQPREQQVLVGKWMFDLVVGASAHTLWGPQNPWNEDHEFMRQFVILSDNFESLSLPMARLASRRAYRARQFLIERLMTFHREHPQGVETSVAHRINAIAMSDQDWQSNVDYYRCELLEALGLLPTASTLSVWLVRHLLADPELRRKVTEEVRRVEPAKDDDESHGNTTSSSSCSPSGRLDLSDIRTRCPHLVAAWHETLRLHVTAVPRVVTGDFELPVPSRATPVAVKEKDVILLPMLAFNLDPQTWGPDAGTFSAERFLDGSGRLSTQRTRKVRGFGVAGNLCPGRNFGFETAMAAVATLLHDFDVESGVCPAPRPMAGMNVGFERLADDVPVRLTRVGPM
ncbi:cytochrome p450 [Hirsutella rhossiliensis]|uniref:Cytochrome p450 domain-containing protein n=1 Tax=Hirsutella rhossiliensis TaxID=111463 RepID=A0A9P8N9R9_9HYPO|nr:cytochrome p450 domain-containing protein [Hirsutella rhossiliensis]KAH0968606.1 cytochrome p450 domain-containing protein [Hirsutella rhossiliensis]